MNQLSYLEHKNLADALNVLGTTSISTYLTETTGVRQGGTYPIYGLAPDKQPQFRTQQIIERISRCTQFLATQTATMSEETAPDLLALRDKLDFGLQNFASQYQTSFMNKRCGCFSRIFRCNSGSAIKSAQKNFQTVSDLLYARQEILLSARAKALAVERAIRQGVEEDRAVRERKSNEALDYLFNLYPRLLVDRVTNKTSEMEHSSDINELNQHYHDFEPEAHALEGRFKNDRATKKAPPQEVSRIAERISQVVKAFDTVYATRSLSLTFEPIIKEMSEEASLMAHAPSFEELVLHYDKSRKIAYLMESLSQRMNSKEAEPQTIKDISAKISQAKKDCDTAHADCSLLLTFQPLVEQMKEVTQDIDRAPTQEQLLRHYRGFEQTAHTLPERFRIYAELVNASPAEVAHLSEMISNGVKAFDAAYKTQVEVAAQNQAKQKQEYAHQRSALRKATNQLSVANNKADRLLASLKKLTPDERIAQAQKFLGQLDEIQNTLRNIPLPAQPEKVSEELRQDTEKLRQGIENSYEK